MDTTKLRRTGALIASAALLASLTVATVAAPTTAARPKCDGKVATIVSYKKVIRGTNRADVIVAKGRKNNKIYGYGGGDRICGGKGNDTIIGGGNADRLFGGSGRDKLLGKRGNDDLFGFKGDDAIFGGGGNDFMNGGTGTDNCFQGSGSGPVKNCEIADLEVEVTGPASAPEGTVDLTVRVTNNGPDDSSYVLRLDRVDGGAECERPPASVIGPVLAAGAERSLNVALHCTIEGANPGITLLAEVVTRADDPKPSNNTDENDRTLLTPSP